MDIEFIRNRSDYEELIDSGRYRNIGGFVEDMVYRVLTSIFPKQFVVFEPKYKIDGQEKELVDILVLWDNVLLLFECKGRELRAYEEPGKIGRREDWIEKVCSNAGKQLRRAVKLITSRILVARNEEAVLAIDMAKVEMVVPSVVLFLVDDFFWSEKLLRRKRKYPELQLFDLRALWLVINYLDSADAFVDYVVQRSLLYRAHKDLLEYDEHLLMYYLVNKGSLESLIESARPSIEIVDDIPPFSTLDLYKPEMKNQLKLIMNTWKAIGPKWRARLKTSAE